MMIGGLGLPQGSLCYLGNKEVNDGCGVAAIGSCRLRVL